MGSRPFFSARSRPIIVDIAISAPARSIDAHATSTSRLRMTSRIETWCTSTSYIDFSSESGSMPCDIVRLPWGSMSTQSTRWPFSAKAAARLSVVVVFATPPFWLAKAMTLAWPVTSCSDRSRENPSALPVRGGHIVSCMPHARTARRINRAHWDALAAVHGQDAYYDTEALLTGADSLHDAETAGVREAVGAVAGLDVLHLQCHIGFDAVSLARRGARVVGADFSPVSLEKARTLARRCEVRVEFVEADATKLPVELHNRFDLVYATIGVITWIDEMRAWMRSAAAALRGGGKLLLVDGHPLYTMIDTLDP